METSGTKIINNLYILLFVYLNFIVYHVLYCIFVSCVFITDYYVMHRMLIFPHPVLRLASKE